MKISFGQIYIEQGAEFPFSHICMRYLDEQVSSTAIPSAQFIAKFGNDFDLIFRISAKHALDENEIRGPTVFRKDRDVEYTIFLPFNVIIKEAHPPTAALKWIFHGIYDVFDRLGIDSIKLRERQELIVQHICRNAEMFRIRSYDVAPGVGAPVWTALQNGQ